MQLGDFSQSQGSMGFLWTLIQFLQPYVGPALSLGYPLYASIEAIESPFKEDDEQWLTYWVIYSFLALFEVAFERVLEVIPIWPAVKIILVAWLVLPQFRGACFVYRAYIRQILWKLPLRQHHLSYDEHHHEEYSECQKDVLQTMSHEARTAVAQYISDHGAHSFGKLINSACKHGSKSKSSPKTPKSPKSPIRMLFKTHSPNS